ncbi:MAG TPA: HAMP domain-containing sensor histidine kinase [Kofleriaceae bacterium]|nr:HAMP domain-containing sensor histidine kinase [Kofleriaceae bacterium]
MRPAKPSRTLYAALLLVAALAALLVLWFLSGWADVRAQQRELRAAPARAAAEAGAALAHELRGELAQLMTRELERPYFHYQNLMHDPRAGATLNVSPSPLASGPADPLVLGYFQVDAAGKASTPTINDDIPSLSDPKGYAENASFRDEVARSFVASLRPPPVVASGRGTRVAAAAPGTASAGAGARPVPQRPPVQTAQANVGPPPQAQAPPQVQAPPQAQVVEIDESSYAQNVMPSEVYRQQNALPRVSRRSIESARQQSNAPPQQEQQQAKDPQQQQQQQASEPPPQQQAPPPQQQSSAPPQQQAPRLRRVAPSPPPASPPPPAAEEPPAPVTITISPLEWRTLPYAGAPALVAVRHVETPDGDLAQGFVIDRASLTRWLSPRAGDAAVLVKTGPAASESHATELAPGWYLDVAASPHAIAASAAEATHVAAAFVARFVIAGVIALFAAALVVLLVSRAERLARERSQFAAAAAHELRTPLAGLQLYGDMLADGLGDPSKMRDYARRMSEEASRLGRVVSNVLGFSQLERGNLSVDARPGNLGAALCELADRAQPALDRAGAVLDLDVPPELAARFDRDALARIVGNLLDNAEKYSRGAEDRTIQLAARDVGEHVEIVIADHGPGIAPAARGKLFRAFSRGVSSDGPAGLGLGLALSQSLARAMGGDLEHRPAPDRGAVFVVRLTRA